MSLELKELVHIKFITHDLVHTKSSMNNNLHGSCGHDDMIADNSVIVMIVLIESFRNLIEKRLTIVY